MDAFGNVTKTDSITDSYGGMGGQWGYVTEGPFYRLGLRFYDPATGRFLTRDPIGYDGGINLYGYVGNNAVNFIDPTGTNTATLTWGRLFTTATETDLAGGGPEDPVGDVIAGGIIVIGGGYILGNAIHDDWLRAHPAHHVVCPPVLAESKKTKLGTNQRENNAFERIARKHGLDKREQRRLHDEISKQGYSEEEIDEMAQDIVNSR